MYNFTTDTELTRECTLSHSGFQYNESCIYTNGTNTWHEADYEISLDIKGSCYTDQDGEQCCHIHNSSKDENGDRVEEDTEEGSICEALDQQNGDNENNQGSEQDPEENENQEGTNQGNESSQDPNNEGGQNTENNQNSEDINDNDNEDEDEDEQSNTNDDLNDNGNNHEGYYSQGQGLVANSQYAEEYVEACGCGDHPELALPQDNLGFISLEGPLIYCPTVCWIEDNIIDLLYKHVFVPIEGDVSYNTVGDQISS